MSDLVKQSAMDAHQKGYIHIHRFNDLLGYCASFDLREFNDARAKLLTNNLIQEWPGCLRLSVKEEILSLNTASEFYERIRHVNGDMIFYLPMIEEMTKFVESFNDIIEKIPTRFSLGVMLNEKFPWLEDSTSKIFTLASNYGSPIFINGKPVENQLQSVWVKHGEFRFNVGTIGSVSLNLPRFAFETRNEDSLLPLIGENLQLAAKWLESKRLDLAVQMKNGNMPATSQMGIELDEFYGSISLVGMHEALRYLIDSGIETMQGKAVAYKVLEYISKEVKELENNLGHHFCLDAVPTDGASHRLADLDRKHRQKYNVQSEESYTNSTWLPDNYTDDLWDALEHQRKLQSFFNGTTIFDVPVPSEIGDPEGCNILVRRIIERFGMPCISISPYIRICKTHGRQEGNAIACPICSEPLEQSWRWELGYRKESELNEIQREDWRRRRPFDVVSGW